MTLPGELDLYRRLGSAYGQLGASYQQYMSPRIQQTDIGLWQGQPIQQPSLAPWQETFLTGIGKLNLPITKGVEFATQLLAKYGYKSPEAPTLKAMPWELVGRGMYAGTKYPEETGIILPFAVPPSGKKVVSAPQARTELERKMWAEYGQLPWWKKAIYEAPFWILAAGAGSAAGATRAGGWPKPVRMALGIEKPRPSPAQMKKFLPTAQALLGKAPKPKITPAIAKTAGAAIEQAKPTGGIYTPAIDKLRQVLKIQRETRGKTTALYKAERAKRFALAEQRMAEAPAGEKYEAALSAMGKELPKSYVKIPDELLLTKVDLQGLESFISQSAKLNTGEKLTALEAIRKWPQFARGQIESMQPHEIKLLNRIFFPKRGLTAKTWQQVLDAANAPRAVLSACDLSSTVRQGLFETIWQGLKHPVRTTKSVWNSFKILLGKRGIQTYQQLDDILRADPEFAKAQGWGAYFAPNIKEGGRIAAREEMYASKLAAKVPWIKRSEASFTYYLNRIRLDAWKDVAPKLERLGGKDTDFSMLAKIINTSTGRGDIRTLSKMFGGNIGPALNASLFSPRLLISRFQYPYYSMKAIVQNPLLRTEVAGRLATTTAIVGSIIALLRQSGVAKVELDRRSADFLKIQIGNTRLDPWAGYQQIFRFLYQLVVAERKLTTTGEIREVNRWALISQFLQSKESPVVGMLHDLMVGETYYGEAIEPTKESAARFARERFTPLFINDLWTAFEDEGLIGAGVASPGFFGVGVMTYKPAPLKPLRTPSEIRRGYGLGQSYGILGEAYK